MSNLKLKSIPSFPGLIIAGIGISAQDNNGNWVISLDYSQIPLVSPYMPQATDYVLIFDATANQYFLVPVTSFT